MPETRKGTFYLEHKTVKIGDKEFDTTDMIDFRHRRDSVAFAPILKVFKELEAQGKVMSEDSLISNFGVTTAILRKKAKEHGYKLYSCTIKGIRYLLLKRIEKK